MCELDVYVVSGDTREKVMESVVRLTTRNGKVLLDGILGESKEVEGRLDSVNIIAQEAVILR
ncbi:MAG: CooT family nickel-binding protein [Methanotrichaceae archaeon]|nr:CooT family nickel-binding protein [Methanotrichaceae archaeon]